jgi:hypothetical protein
MLQQDGMVMVEMKVLVMEMMMMMILMKSGAMAMMMAMISPLREGISLMYGLMISAREFSSDGPNEDIVTPKLRKIP